jgi:fatty acid desaturase
MPPVHDPDKLRERTLLLALLMLFLFATPFTLWWASSAFPWLLPYLLWLLVIILGAIISYRFNSHDL